jgi:glycosyltransferase involved in cell wall biosynthesis
MALSIENPAVEAIAAHELPNVIILTGTCVSMAHGTGSVLTRHFADYPQEKIFNIYGVQYGEPTFQKLCYVPHPPKSPPAGLTRRYLKHVLRMRAREAKRWLTSAPGYATARSIRACIDRTGFVPEVVYASVYDHHNLEILWQLLRAYQFRLPVIQHFHDYLSKGHDAEVKQKFRRLAPHLTEVWSLTSTMAEEFAPAIGRDIPLVGVFHTMLPSEYKQTHRAFDKDFSAVMLGNVWMPEVLNDLRAAWRWLGERVGGLPPIAWYGHDTSVERVEKSGVQFGPEIQYGGFLPHDELYRRLCNADIAIVPFNRQDEPESDYARFSLPSRITEFTSAGLPIFFAAGARTEPARLVDRSGIGMHTAPHDQDRLRERLLHFSQDRELRAACGARSRELAEQEYDLEKYRPFLYGTLCALARTSKQRG